METLSNLWNGRIGLAKTYWVYGILGGALWGIPLALVTPGSFMAIMLLLAFIAYCMLVNTGIWRAANHYHGQAAWATLAKIVAAVSYASLLLVTIGLIGAAWDAIGKSTPQTTPQALSQDSQPTPHHQQQAPQVNWSDYTPVEKPAPVATPQQQLQPSLSAQEIHMQQIYAAHADADTVFTNADFQDWLMRTPQFKNTPSVGSTQEVIDMFSAYKRLYEPDWWKKNATPVN